MDRHEDPDQRSRRAIPDGKTERQLTGYDKLNTFVRYSAWSPSGDRIVYEYAVTTGNIWLIELK